MVNAAVVIDKNTGQTLMVVVPDNENQLKDTAYNPPNSVQILIPLDTYRISSYDQLDGIVSQARKQMGIDLIQLPLADSAPL